jgi:phage terminase large subunit
MGGQRTYESWKLSAIRDYPQRTDDKRGVSLGPVHDWASHAADALRYPMLAYEEPRPPRPKRTFQVSMVPLGWMSY